MPYVLPRLIIKDKITNPVTAKIASNPDTDVCEFGAGFTVDCVVPGVSVSSAAASTLVSPSLCDVDPGFDVRSAPPSADAVCVGEGIGADMDTEPVVLPPLDDPVCLAGVGVGGVDTSPEVNDPLSIVAEIWLDDLSYNEITLIFNGLEPAPTAVNSTFAKTISPLAPPAFDEDIAVNPMTLLLLNAELPVTAVTCTTAGS